MFFRHVFEGLSIDVGRNHVTVANAHHSLGRKPWVTKLVLGSQPANTVFMAADDCVHCGCEQSMLEQIILALQKGNQEIGMHPLVAISFATVYSNSGSRSRETYFPHSEWNTCICKSHLESHLTDTTRCICLFFPGDSKSSQHDSRQIITPYLTIPIYWLLYTFPQLCFEKKKSFQEIQQSQEAILCSCNSWPKGKRTLFKIIPQRYVHIYVYCCNVSKSLEIEWVQLSII